MEIVVESELLQILVLVALLVHCLGFHLNLFLLGLSGKLRLFGRFVDDDFIDFVSYIGDLNHAFLFLVPFFEVGLARCLGFLFGNIAHGEIEVVGGFDIFFIQLAGLVNLIDRN